MTQQTYSVYNVYSVEELEKLLESDWIAPLHYAAPEIARQLVEEKKRNEILMRENERYSKLHRGLEDMYEEQAREIQSLKAENDRLGKLMTLRDKISMEYEGGALRQIQSLKAQVEVAEKALEEIDNVCLSTNYHTIESDIQRVAREALTQLRARGRTQKEGE